MDEYLSEKQIWCSIGQVATMRYTNALGCSDTIITHISFSASGTEFCDLNSLKRLPTVSEA